MLKITKGLKPFVEDGISIYTDGQGRKYVRVRADDEDFCIACSDYVKDGGEWFSWDDAMKSSKALGLTLPTKEQVSIYNNYRDKINNKLKGIGGSIPTLLHAYYWTSIENSNDSAVAFSGCKNVIINDFKNIPHRVRPILNLNDK